jgi:hypothetical protein
VNPILVRLLRLFKAHRRVQDGIEDGGQATIFCVFEVYLERIKLLPLRLSTFDILAVTNTLGKEKRPLEIIPTTLIRIGSPQWTLFATFSTHLRWR